MRRRDEVGCALNQVFKLSKRGKILVVCMTGESNSLRQVGRSERKVVERERELSTLSFNHNNQEREREREESE